MPVGGGRGQFKLVSSPVTISEGSALAAPVSASRNAPLEYNFELSPQAQNALDADLAALDADDLAVAASAPRLVAYVDERASLSTPLEATGESAAQSHLQEDESSVSLSIRSADTRHGVLV